MGSGLGFASLAWSIDQSVLGSGVELITHLLFQNPHETHWSWIFGRFFGSLLSYISGCAGGIFAPSLAIGGTIGAELSKFFGSDNPNLMILLGMIGFLTGVTRAPFTAFVLVLEMTDRHSAIFPMMVTSLTALGASQFISRHSFYESIKTRYLKVI
jgi:H+/Cl- antiporter ClcA